MTQAGQPILGVVPVEAAGAPLFFQDGEFKDTLTIGQIIKGRVLRHFGGDRYLVNFSGRNRVVDSVIPLATNEIVFGRVVGLGDRVELRRVRDVADAVSEPSDKSDMTSIESLSAGDAIQKLQMELAQYQVRLSLVEMQQLVQFVGRARDPEMATLSAVVLYKLGLKPISWQFLELMQETLSRKSGLFPSDKRAISLASGVEMSDAPPRDNSAFLAAFSKLLFVLSGGGGRSSSVRSGESAAQVAEEWNSVRASEGGETTGDLSGRSQLNGDQSYATALLLNAQTEGAIAHRVCTIPLLIDGELVELDVALFEQGEGGAGEQESHRYRQVVLSLEMSQFGLIEVSATLSGDHIRIVVMAAKEEATEALALHAGRLREELETNGWSVDELRYETKIDRGANAVPRTVVEHIIARDSLSRLV